MRLKTNLFSFLLCFLICHSVCASHAKQHSSPLASTDGSILLDHGTKLIGNFHVQNVGDFFTVTPLKFSARLFTPDHQNPPLQNFYVDFRDFGADKELRYSLKIVNDFQHGISLIYTRDQRLIAQDIYQSESVHGTIIYLAHSEYKKYVGEIKNLTFDGPGALELTNGQTYVGRFSHGSLNGIFLNAKEKVVLQFVNNKLISSMPMQKQTCHDPYLGDFHLSQGTCHDSELKTHSANFKDNLLVYNGHFKNGKLWQGEIVPMALNTQGTFGKFENGLPTGVVRIQKKDGMTLGTLQDGKLQGQIATYNFKTGERFVGQYEHGKKQGPFRLLSYNSEILQKGSYKNDQLDGTLFSYDDQTHLKSVDQYQAGKKLGKTTYFNPDGTPKK